MNILILSSSLKLGGGAEKFSTNLGNELNRRGHEIYHLTFLVMNILNTIFKENI